MIFLLCLCGLLFEFMMLHVYLPLYFYYIFVFCFYFQTPAPPKVTNLKIIGDLRENSKITASGNVIGGTEGSSRVQWFKTSSSTLEGEKGLEALSTSKIAKVEMFNFP